MIVLIQLYWVAILLELGRFQSLASVGSSPGPERAKKKSCNWKEMAVLKDRDLACDRCSVKKQCCFSRFIFRIIKDFI